jgi:HK97 family phage portal protein
MIWDRLARAFKPPAVKSAGGYQLMDGFLPASAGSLMNFWQCGFDVQSRGRSAIVEACVSAYAQTVAMCPGGHWRLLDNGGRERVTTSALSRVLRKPNQYSTISDFMLNSTTSLYSDGNAYALALRNDRFEIDSLHLMQPRQCAPRIAPDGSLFYSLGGNEIIEKMFDNEGAKSLLEAVPARDVLHVKLRSRSNNPLLGESPIVSAALDDAAQNAILQQSLAFYLNASRPSGILTSDQHLSPANMQELRAAWEEKSAGINQGKVPILSHGLKFQPMAPTAHDSQVAEIMGYSDKRIAAVFRVPLSILNLADNATQGSTESLMQFWIGTGLGFALNHLEEAFGRTFGLFGVPSEYLEFDTAALLRSLFKDRVDAYARGVQGGIFDPNYARNEFELPKVTDGDDVRVQQQMVPLSYGADLQPPTPGASTPAPPTDTTPADNGDLQDGNGQRDFAELIRAAADRYTVGLNP